MGRKTIGILTVLLLFALVAGWYYFTSESKYFNTPAFKAVPKNSAIIVRIPNISVFSARAASNFLPKEYSSFPGLSFISSHLHLVDSVFQNNPASRKYLADKSITLAFGGSEGKKSLLYFIELADMAEKTTLKNLFHDYFNQRKASLISRKEGEISASIYYWSHGPSRITFCITFYKGIFIAGSDPQRVIEAAEQLDLTSPQEDPAFQRITKTASPNADLNIYLNRKFTGELFSPLFSGSLLKHISPNLPVDSWTEIDCNLKKEELLFNGFTIPADSLHDYTAVLINQKPIPFHLVLPAETSFFKALSIGDIPAYFKDYEQMLNKKGKLDPYQHALSEIDTLYGINLQNFIKDYSTGQSAMVFTRFDASNALENRYLVVGIKNVKTVDSLMGKLVKTTPVFRGLTREFKMGKDTIFKMSQIPVNNFGERVFGAIYQGVPTSFYTICDSCLIMSGSFNALEDYLQSMNLKETLDKTPLFKEYTGSLSQPASLYLWGIPSLCLSFFKADLHPGLFRDLQDTGIKLQQINSFGWQIGADQGMIYHVGRVSYSPVSLNKPMAVWRFHADSTLITRPFFVNNPDNPEKPDVLVQDQGNKVYLISNSGNLLWKKNLSAPLMSQVFQVNYFKDRRIQYLFNTSEAIHLIERDGNDIAGFPVSLKSKATNPIGVFDYDRTMDYRIFVACEDKNIYAFDRNGIRITGWETPPVVDRVTSPVQFFRVLGKDYLLYTDKKNIYIRDRKGNPRLVLQEEITPSLHNGFYLEKATESTPERLVTTDHQGTIVIINFDGSVKKITAGNFSDRHYFLAADLDKDEQIEYVIQDGDSLFVYNLEGGLIFKRSFPNSIDQAPQIFDLQEKGYKLGVADIKGNQIYLINDDGSDYTGFPIEGNSPLNIGILNPGNHRFNLLAGSRDGYLNNYSLK